MGKQKIKYFRISKAVKGFKESWLSKYPHFIDIQNNEQKHKNEPVFMVGLYGSPDYRFIKEHKGPILLRWCGSDTKRIDNNTIKIINSNKQIKHVAIGKFIEKKLKKWGIDYISLPLTPTQHKKQPEPLGECVYFYGNPKHGLDIVNEVEKNIDIDIIKVPSYDSYNKKDLYNIYKKCFLGLRLTQHDGLPNTVLELGLMGRKSIYNGGLPYSIPWESVDDICENIMKEYNKRHCVDYNKISNDFYNYLDIGDGWLEI